MSGSSLRHHVWALAMLGAIAANGSAAAETYVTFSALNGYDTHAYSINADGVVTGQAAGTDTGYGFVRAADGTITTFAVDDNTAGIAINRRGWIAGDSCSMAGACHGLLRKPGGKIVTFDPLGSIYTLVSAINDAGTIAGYWMDANAAFHGFLRTADGTITTFDPAASVATWANAINAKGDVAGYYLDALNQTHGFLRAADGIITSFDAGEGIDTLAYGINGKGAIVGSFNLTACFERTPHGKIRIFEQGQTQTNPTQASAINSHGLIIGIYALDQAPYSSAYVGSPKSGFTSFNVNGGQTQPYSINDGGVIAGSYYDSNTHRLNGFLRMP